MLLCRSGLVRGRLASTVPFPHVPLLHALPVLLLTAAVVAACSQAPVDRQAGTRVPAPRLAPVSTASTATAPIPSRPVYASASYASTSPRASGAFTPAPGSRVTKVRGVYKVGKPYQIAGVTYYPAVEPNYNRVGMASWYGDDFHGKKTANGELFDMTALSAAHPTLPLPSYLYVTNMRNGRTVLVRLNDRGPYKKGRILDLSRAAARALDFHTHGVTEVRVRYAGPAPLEPDDSRERRFLAAQAWGKRSPAPFGLGMLQAVARW